MALVLRLIKKIINPNINIMLKNKIAKKLTSYKKNVMKIIKLTF